MYSNYYDPLLSLLSICFLNHIYKAGQLKKTLGPRVNRWNSLIGILVSLHLEESLGLETPPSNKLIKSIFYRSLKETEHLYANES